MFGAAGLHNIDGCQSGLTAAAGGGMGALVLHLLGEEFAGDEDGRGLSLPPAAWPLLGCLLSAPSHRMNRGSLAGALWPEQDEQSARHCLATAVWRLRKRLGAAAGLIQMDSESIALLAGDGMAIDVLEFEHVATAALRNPTLLDQRVERDRLCDALAIYRGELLPGISHELVELERERLRALFLDAGLEFIRACRRNGELRLACEVGRRICAAEPFREDAQRLLMQALVECGNPAKALHGYREFEALLRMELGVQPTSETRALASQIALGLAGAGSDTPVMPAATPVAAMGARPVAESAVASPRAMLLQARGQMAKSLDLIDQTLAGIGPH